MNDMREQDFPRERHPSIELSDQEHLDRIRPTFTIYTDSPQILPKQTQEGVKNEKSESKSTERKPKKVPTKTNKAAVAKI